MLGIIGAMDEEVAMIKAQLTDVQVETRAAMDFYKGKLEGKEVVVVRSGIGKVNAAMCTQILADIYGVTGVVNTGIAGSLILGTLCFPAMQFSMIWMQPDLAMNRDRYPGWRPWLLRQMKVLYILRRNVVPKSIRTSIPS